jgi:hypothetical protein
VNAAQFKTRAALRGAGELAWGRNSRRDRQIFRLHEFVQSLKAKREEVCRILDMPELPPVVRSRLLSTALRRIRRISDLRMLLLKLDR